MVAGVVLVGLRRNRIGRNRCLDGGRSGGRIVSGFAAVGLRVVRRGFTTVGLLSLGHRFCSLARGFWWLFTVVGWVLMWVRHNVGLWWMGHDESNCLVACWFSGGCWVFGSGCGCSFGGGG